MDDPVLEAFHEAGLFLPEEGGMKCRRCERWFRWTWEDNSVFCPSCLESTDPQRQAEDRYWLAHGELPSGGHHVTYSRRFV